MSIRAPHQTGSAIE